MPSYVVSKVGWGVLGTAWRVRRRGAWSCAQQVSLALNDRCKAVNGSRILIVGVAYKVLRPLSRMSHDYIGISQQLIVRRLTWRTAAKLPRSTFGLFWSKWAPTSAIMTPSSQKSKSDPLFLPPVAVPFFPSFSNPFFFSFCQGEGRAHAKLNGVRSVSMKHGLASADVRLTSQSPTMPCPPPQDVLSRAVILIATQHDTPHPPYPAPFQSLFDDVSLLRQVAVVVTSHSSLDWSDLHAFTGVVVDTRRVRAPAEVSRA
jgi:hypothetical protein